MAGVCTVAASIATWAETSNPCAYPRCGACVAYNCAVCGNWCASTPFRIYALHLRPSNTAAVKVCVHFWIDTVTHCIDDCQVFFIAAYWLRIVRANLVAVYLLLQQPHQSIVR